MTLCWVSLTNTTGYCYWIWASVNCHSARVAASWANSISQGSRFPISVGVIVFLLHEISEPGVIRPNVYLVLMVHPPRAYSVSAVEGHSIGEVEYVAAG